MALVASVPAPLAFARDGQPGDVLHIPGLPPIQMPPGAHVYGSDGDDAGRQDSAHQDQVHQDPAEPDTDLDRPHRAIRDFGDRIMPDGRQGLNRPDLGSTVIGPGGVIKRYPPAGGTAEAAKPKKKILTPEEKSAAITKALQPKPSLAFSRRRTLDDLYGKLAMASDADEAKGLATLIGTIWMRSGSDTANLLMQRAAQAIEKKDYPLALDVLDRLVALKPSWAEAWNKRASVRYFAGDLDGSMVDVEHVLKLEPNHFGALEGMATILQRTGLDKRALEIYRRALAVYPHQPDVEKIVSKLTLQVEGQGI
jgi:tetratricopeptide (TPR) repeat protein